MTMIISLICHKSLSSALNRCAVKETILKITDKKDKNLHKRTMTWWNNDPTITNKSIHNTVNPLWWRWGAQLKKQFILQILPVYLHMSPSAFSVEDRNKIHIPVKKGVLHTIKRSKTSFIRMTSNMASIHFTAAWPFRKQNCLPLHMSNNISLHI